MSSREGRRPHPACPVVVALGLLAAACGGSSPEATPTPEPTQVFAWSPETPSAAGFDVDVLRAGLDTLEAADSNAHQLVVARGRDLVIDTALWPGIADQPHDLASITKSVVALVVGAAIERGDIDSLEVTLGDLLDLPPASPTAAARLRDLLGMRSGLECSATDGESQLEEMLRSPDYVAYAAALPAAGPAGEDFAYCSPGYHLVSAAIAETTGARLEDYAGRVLFEPVGIEEWSWPEDAQGVTHGWGDLALAPRDLARLGRLVLDDGRWEDQAVLPRGFVDDLRAPIATDDPDVDYGLGWWLPTDEAAGALEALGRGGQTLLVRADRDLVVAVTGAEVDGPLIARTVAGAVLDDAAVDPAADEEIATRFARLARPPAPTPGTTPGPTPNLETTFALEANPLGISRFRVVAGDDDTVTLEMTVGGQAYALPAGLDGVARVTPAGPSEEAVALAAAWDGAVLTVDYEATRGPDHLTFAADLGPVFSLTISDLASRFPTAVVRGTPTP